MAGREPSAGAEVFAVASSVDHASQVPTARGALRGEGEASLLDRIFETFRLASAALPNGLAIANRAHGAPLFGLVAFHSIVRTEWSPREAALHVRCGPASAVIPGEKVADRQPSGQWRILFHVNTHLIPDGRHALEAELRWRDGKRVPLRGRSCSIANTGELAAAVRRDLLESGTPAVFGRTVDSSLFPYDRGRTRAWFEERPAADVPLSLEPARSDAAAHEHLSRWGFCILKEQLPAKLIDQFWSSVDAAITSGKLPYKAGSGDRIRNAHRLRAGRKVWLFPPVIDFLRRHFRDEPCACQTLTYPHGSEQRPHQDTIHLTSYPSGFMCGVWIALQDVMPDSGELVVYPGSHLAPRLRAGALGLAKVDTDYSSYVVFDEAIEGLLRTHGYQPVLYRPKAGEILVWHENLIHGGSPRRKRALTRKSIVSHYFARGAVVYYDSRGEAAYLEGVS